MTGTIGVPEKPRLYQIWTLAGDYKGELGGTGPQEADRRMDRRGRHESVDDRQYRGRRGDRQPAHSLGCTGRWKIERRREQRVEEHADGRPTAVGACNGHPWSAAGRVQTGGHCTRDGRARTRHPMGNMDQAQRGGRGDENRAAAHGAARNRLPAGPDSTDRSGPSAGVHAALVAVARKRARRRRAVRVVRARVRKRRPAGSAQPPVAIGISAARRLHVRQQRVVPAHAARSGAADAISGLQAPRNAPQGRPGIPARNDGGHDEREADG